ncbi:MAG: uroporphyrinogen-III C-methyltransferase [Deltaproteobacteria bacterium]|nr:uroporphyrinogen-III C-methyltransferase [Deltaproteobacteria bacterium]
MSGRVFLVGAGPGDPELLTLRAARVIREADVVVYDRLVHPDVLAHARPHARLIYVGKEGGGTSTSQADIHALLVAQARLGRNVVRLKGGDPFVFGRGGEEALALDDAGVSFEVVSGVSAGFAVPAAAGIPVTHRGLSGSVTFATAVRNDGEPDWAHLARSETLVVFMSGQRLSSTTSSLMAAGRSGSTLAAVIEAGTWEHQRVIEGTLSCIAVAAADVGSPALLVVGEVVGLRSRLQHVVDVGLQRCAQGG